MVLVLVKVQESDVELTNQQNCEVDKVSKSFFGFFGHPRRKILNFELRLYIRAMQSYLKFCNEFFAFCLI